MENNYLLKLLKRRYKRMQINILIIMTSGILCVLAGLYCLLSGGDLSASALTLSSMGGIFLILDLIIYFFSYRINMDKIKKFETVKVYPKQQDIFLLSEKLTSEANENNKITYTIGNSIGEYLETYPSFILKVNPYKVDIITLDAATAIFGKKEVLSQQEKNSMEYYVCFQSTSEPEPYLIPFHSEEAVRDCLDFLFSNYQNIVNKQFIE